MDHLIFTSVADAECFDKHTKHLNAKVELEKYLRQSGVPFSILRRLFLKDLHHVFLYYEVQKGPRGTPEAFKKVMPDALSAEDWFRFHGRYANGESIAAKASSG